MDGSPLNRKRTVANLRHDYLDLFYIKKTARKSIPGSVAQWIDQCLESQRALSRGFEYSLPLLHIFIF